MKPIQACDKMSPLTPKRARPNRLCFRRALSCSSMTQGNRTTNKNIHGSLSKHPAINVINEEASNVTEDVFVRAMDGKQSKQASDDIKTNNNDNSSLNQVSSLKNPPKTTIQSEFCLPVISVTCEDQTSEQNTSCDKPLNIALSVDPPSPSRRTKSVPGSLLVGI